MSAWPGKYVIGLTGNIATGKSVVRKMLEHLGAYGIDADALSHRVIAKDAPGFKPVVDHFGKWILGEDGQIDRTKLGRVIFNDPEAMAQLESIVHPAVRQAIDALIRRATQPVIVVEAIKLLESPMRQSYDSIWVANATAEVQLARLIQKRGLTEAAARQRIQAQAPQSEKIAAANVVIQNDGNFGDTWKQVSAAWEKFQAPEPVAAQPPKKVAPAGQFVVERARPRQAEDIAGLINRLSQGKRQVNADDIMEAFGEKAYLLLKAGDQPVGLVGWQVENLVARTNDLYVEANIPLDKAMQAMMEEVEIASKDLQCEALLLFLTPQMAQQSVWKPLGYEQRSVQTLGVRAWQEAAQESLQEGYTMLFKQLRKDRVLRPV
jgi:dephospho-CoA kinase